MVWPLIAMAGLSLIGQMQQNKSAAKQQLGEARAVQEANTKNFHRTMFQVGMANIQRAEELRILTQRKADLGAQELQAAGQTANNAAASGTVGASVDIVQSDVEAQFDRARAEIDDENIRSISTHNLDLQQILMDGQNQIQSIRKPQVMGMGEMLLNTGIQVGSIYAQRRMELGLGTQKTPPGAMRG